MKTNRAAPNRRDVLRRVAAALTARGQTVAVAESCTAGGLGWALTTDPGSSAFFKGGVIAYANDAKKRLLNVAPGALAAHGAVSEPVAVQMAEGARRVFRAAFGVAITGVAGPAGGTKDKPVGTVWLAVAGPVGAVRRCVHLCGARRRVREQAIVAALRMLDAELRRPAPANVTEV